LNTCVPARLGDGLAMAPITAAASKGATA